LDSPEIVVRVFFTLQRPDRLCWQQSFRFDGYWRILSPSGKTANVSADHSTASGAEFKNEWSYTATPSFAFMACDGTTPLSFCPLMKRRGVVVRTNAFYYEGNSIKSGRGRRYID
jgi:hypothetical protein